MGVHVRIKLVAQLKMVYFHYISLILKGFLLWSSAVPFLCPFDLNVTRCYCMLRPFGVGKKWCDARDERARVDNLR